MKIFIKFSICVLMCLITVPVRGGQDESFAACGARCQADKHCESGQKAVESKQPVEAVKHFVRALLSDPSHIEAKSSLRKLASSYDDEFLKYRMKVYRVQELLDYIAFVKQQIAAYPEGDVIRKETFDIDGSQGYDGLDGVIDYLALTKRRLVDQYLELQSSPGKNLPRTKISAPAKLADVRPQEGLGVLQSQMDRLRQEVNALQEGASRSEKRIAELTSQLTQKSLDIYEKDSLLMQQKEGYIALQDSLLEAQERLNLVQRIMQEKDSKLQAMDRDVKTLQAFAEQYRATSEEDVQSLRQEFSALQKDLVAQISSSREKIDAMQGTLARQERKMVSLSIAAQAKGKRIAQMNRVLVQKNKRIKHREEIIGWQGERLSEAGGILEIYKGKLRETSQLLQEKIERIRELESQSAERAF